MENTRQYFAVIARNPGGKPSRHRFLAFSEHGAFRLYTGIFEPNIHLPQYKTNVISVNPITKEEWESTAHLYNNFM